VSPSVATAPPTVRAEVDAALAARARIAGRPLGETAAALAAAAERWRSDAELVAALPAAAGLAPPVVVAGLAFAAEALDLSALHTLIERELGPGAIDRPPPTGAAYVAHSLASNVPALALPAIALSCLVGAAVLVKSGRNDRLSAPAFRRALAAVDPALAATVLTPYWKGGDLAAEDAGLARADLVIVTGGDAALTRLAGRVQGRLIRHGPRISVAAIAAPALADAGALADALAVDVALHDQRGCLSPHVVYVETDGAETPRAFAERLAAALDALVVRWPLGPVPLEERARTGLARAEAGWQSGTTVFAGNGGTVIYDSTPAPAEITAGRRTVRVHPLASLERLADLVPAGLVECVGLAGTDAAPLAPALRARGVARICPVGRMQRPPLSWPRGQRAPLGTLLGRDEPPRLEVEP
jgi:acyl-CoA reductase-like NAD-dependent aldehyde dehydrogenase